jgi:hypothetical protein
MAKTAPAESDVLCESCGYILNGLPPDGKCPECGNDIEESTSAALRTPPAWEDPQLPQPAWMRFLATTFQIIIHTRRFYRGLNSRGGLAGAQSFGRIHYALAAIMFSLAYWLHFNWYQREIVRFPWFPSWGSTALLIVLPPITYLALLWTVSLAARLTTWEGRYRGYRLPHEVVLRALYYHSANYLPVGIVALATVAGYNFLLDYRIVSNASATTYLFVLCGEIILCAVYLFNTYWIGMRNLLYANR